MGDVRSEVKRGFAYFVTSGFIIFAIATFICMCNEPILTFTCPIKYWFGLYCPGCGGTRMCKCILQGRLYQAFRYNMLAFCGIPLYIYIYIMCGIDIINNGKLSKKRKIMIVITLIAVVTFGILRNIGLFRFLQPTTI